MIVIVLGSKHRTRRIGVYKHGIDKEIPRSTWN